MTLEKQTYENLMKLVEKDEAFFFKDFKFDEQIYRIFNYRLASWTSFHENPSAKDCRGIMFDITNKDDVKLSSFPPGKFFNYEEGNVNHANYKIGDKMEKMDGSLISTYLHKGQLYLKSKMSLFSDQAQAANDLLSSNEKLSHELKKIQDMGYTTSLEFTSPNNPIVITYTEDKLTVLSIRSHENGQNLFASKLKEFLMKHDFSECLKNLVSYQNLSKEKIDQEKFMNEIRQEEKGEGYVFEIIVNDDPKDYQSYLVKGKNLKYIALHHTKDSVNSNKKLFEAIVREASDDLRALFANDEYVLQRIQAMEDNVKPVYNHIVQTVEKFNTDNKSLSKKEFALKAIDELPRAYQSLAINLYIGRENDYKTFAIKHQKDIFKIDDVTFDVEEGRMVNKKIRHKMP